MFDIGHIAFKAWGYPLSYLEMIGVLFGLAAVWLMAKEKRAGWLFGLVNVVLAALLYYQVQLYSDFFLQIYFFATNLYGWWYWKGPDASPVPTPVRTLDRWGWVMAIAFTAVGTYVIGHAISRLHLWFPSLFPHAAAYPFADTVVLTLSLVAQYLLARKVVDSWLLWIAVDVLATYLYFQKYVWFLAFEYLIFTFLALLGWLHWRKQMRFKQTLKHSGQRPS